MTESDATGVPPTEALFRQALDQAFVHHVAELVAMLLKASNTDAALLRFDHDLDKAMTVYAMVRGDHDR